MLATIILWGHALAALLFAALTIWTLRGQGGVRLPRWLFPLALALTALWSLAVAGIGPGEAVTRLLGSMRSFAWLLLLGSIQRNARFARARSIGALMTFGVVGVVIATQGVLALVASIADPIAATRLDQATFLLQALSSLGALILLHGLFPTAGSLGARLILAAVGAMWLVDTNLCIARYLSAYGALELEAARGVAMALLAGVVGIALSRHDDRELRFSRTVTFHSLSVLGLILYFAAIILITRMIAGLGGEYARLAQTAFVFGSTATALVLGSTGWIRAWVRVKLAKHLFRHRYDYRAEWTRFTDTLGEPATGGPLDQRLVKSVADLTDSPAGLLFVADDGGLSVQAGWRWEGDALPPCGTHALALHLETTGRILEMDEIRTGGRGGLLAEDRAAVPAAMIAREDAWVLVPLPHMGRLTGAILLTRPPIPRRLDWEDFDLLRIAGRQVASYLAEARAQDALSEARRFDEFNRRFAFILHDVKNIVSQLSLVARNAERHADNPAFRADMVATLNESATRMNDLLARLSVREPPRADPLRPVPLHEVAERAAARFRLNAVVADGDAGASAVTDPARLQQVVDHLVRNAIDASDGTPVRIATGADGDAAWIDVIDQGRGMTAAFIRDELFRPFVSSKPTGFGIGAFEARQLAIAMGGRIDVDSRVGEGSRFRVVLPPARPAILEDAA